VGEHRDIKYDVQADDSKSQPMDDKLTEVDLDRFLANVNYATFAICYRRSVCLLSVTLVHPTHRRLKFSAIFSPYDSPENLVF